MLGSTLMVQGTASSVGKSMMTAALCRLYRDRGLRVAPFKAQNMALNAFVTASGHEIGRAQAAQAEAAGVAPTVAMNPVLLKPEGDRRSQVIIEGKVIGSMSAVDYHQLKPKLRDIIRKNLLSLREEYDIVVIEGAGSPAEINLKEGDIVNMFVAKIAPSPVLLVGDIDRGGVFAAFAGTMALLEPSERALVAGLIINKFRGDLALLEPGLRFIHDYTKVPVLGVIPYVERLRLAEEDSLGLTQRMQSKAFIAGNLKIGIVRYPRISNYDEFDSLEHTSGVTVQFFADPALVKDQDLVILPGSKHTIDDLAWLRSSGMAVAIQDRIERGGSVLGICGGCQMLGAEIDDRGGVESSGDVVKALGALPIRTRFARDKLTAQVTVVVKGGSFLGPADPSPLTGYEIHSGIPELLTSQTTLFEITSRSERSVSVGDGFVGANGAAIGSMIHGLFDNEVWRQNVLTALQERRGDSSKPFAPKLGAVVSRDDEYKRLAGVLREHLNMAAIDAAVFGGGFPRG